jgi:histidine triad (HIT) family protein
LSIQNSTQKDCIFCQIVAGERHGAIVYEDERIIAFLDVNQAASGHLLVIPREHVSFWWNLADEDAAAIAIAAKSLAQALREALDPDGIKLEQRNGRASGQEIFHAHLHLIPQGGGRGSSRASRQELDERASEIRSALSSVSSAIEHS